MKTYIYAPKYQQNSGGVKVLYKLNEVLKSLGLDCDILNFGEELENKNSVVIYPEIVSGNPLKAKHVIRWVLYYPSINGGDKVYDDNEHIFTYSNLYLSSIKNSIKGKVYLNTVEPYYVDLNKKRRGICFYTGKGYRPDVIGDTWLEITRSYPANRERLAEIFQRSIAFVCYDPNTVMTLEATLCGCPVVVPPNLFDRYKISEYGQNGICDSFLKLDIAANTLGKVRLIHEELNTKSIIECKMLKEYIEGLYE